MCVKSGNVSPRPRVSCLYRDKQRNLDPLTFELWPACQQRFLFCSRPSQLNFFSTNLHQLLLELLDLGEVELAEDVVHQAGRRPEQLVLLGRRDAVVVVDGVGELGEALVAVQSLVVVGLGGGVIAELQAVQGDAEGAGGKKGNRVLKIHHLAASSARC